jgi:hypothetical protein
MAIFQIQATLTRLRKSDLVSKSSGSPIRCLMSDVTVVTVQDGAGRSLSWSLHLLGLAT